jgi:uncharacterized protein YdhG (YjbR/CyaY superfamily)
MRERARETRAARRGSAAERAEQERREVLDKIRSMPEPDRSRATRIHEIVTTTAPELAPRLWYGMPAYAKDGKVVCFFQAASKFKTRYATLGFNDPARLDDGRMWPTAFAVVELTKAEERRIAELVRRAVR